MKPLQNVIIFPFDVKDFIILVKKELYCLVIVIFVFKYIGKIFFYQTIFHPKLNSYYENIIIV